MARGEADFTTGYAEKAALAAGSLAARMTVMTQPFVMETPAMPVREIIEAR